jgi:hypothetical protein
MVNLKQRNTKKQGDVGLGAAIHFFTNRGDTVSLPLTDSQDYDLVIEMDEALKRVQVKSSSYMRNGSYQVQLSTKGGNRSGAGKITLLNKKRVELIYVITASGQQYLIPTQRAPQHSISLNHDYDEFKVE